MIDPMKILSPMHIDLAKSVLRISNTTELALMMKAVMPLPGVSPPTIIRIAANEVADGEEEDPARKVKLESRQNARASLDALLDLNGYAFVECDGFCRGILHKCAGVKLKKTVPPIS